jgi:tetratricopeptide (TPR) repeat protein
MLLTLFYFYSCAQEYNERARAMKLNNEAMELSFGKDDSIILRNSIKLLNDAISIDSTYILAYSNKVSILFTLKEYIEVIKTIDKLSNFTEENAFNYLMKGISYKKMGDSVQADSSLKSALLIASKFGTNMDKAMYFELLVYFEGKEVALNKLVELYSEGIINEKLYDNFEEVIKQIDETDVFGDF